MVEINENCFIKYSIKLGKIDIFKRTIKIDPFRSSVKRGLFNSIRIYGNNRLTIYPGGNVSDWLVLISERLKGKTKGG